MGKLIPWEEVSRILDFLSVLLNALLHILKYMGWRITLTTVVSCLCGTTVIVVITLIDFMNVIHIYMSHNYALHDVVARRLSTIRCMIVWLKGHHYRVVSENHL